MWANSYSGGLVPSLLTCKPSCMRPWDANGRLETWGELVRRGVS